MPSRCDQERYVEEVAQYLHALQLSSDPCLLWEEKGYKAASNETWLRQLYLEIGVGEKGWNENVLFNGSNGDPTGSFILRSANSM